LNKCFDEIIFPFDKKEYFVNLLRSLNESNDEEIVNVHEDLIGNVDSRKQLSVSKNVDEKRGVEILDEHMAFAKQPMSEEGANYTTFGTGIAQLPSVGGNNKSSTSTEPSGPGKKRKGQTISSSDQRNTKRQRIVCSDEEDKSSGSDYSYSVKPGTGKTLHKKHEPKATEIAAMKQATHRKRLEAITRPTPDLTGVDKYWYLDKKDWDENVMEEVNTSTAADYCKFEGFKLSELAENSGTLIYSEADFDDTQINYKKAKSVIQQLLNVPSKIEYKEQRDKIKDGYWKGQWKHFYKDAKDILETETMVHNYSSVVEIGWQPEDYRQPLKLKDNQLRGHYILKVKKPNSGELVEVIPASDWVEANFTQKALATAQKAFFSYYEKVAIKPNKDQKRLYMKLGLWMLKMNVVMLFWMMIISKS